MDERGYLYAQGQTNGDNYTPDMPNDFRSSRWSSQLVYPFMSITCEENSEGYLNDVALTSSSCQKTVMLLHQ